MGDHAEEQAEEIEALESIFPEQLTVTSPVDLTLTGSAEGGTYDERDFTAGFTLAVHFVPAYPEEAPEVTVRDLDGELEGDEGALAELGSVVAETIEENLGMPVVFAVHAAVQERLEDILTKRRDKAEADHEAARKAEIEAEIERYTAGTLVTPEAFEEWKVKFEAEMAPMREENRRRNQTSADGKLTGRQLFEQKKAKNDSENSLTDKSDVIVDTSVFEGLDLDDLDLPDDGGGDAAAAAAAPS